MRLFCIALWLCLCQAKVTIEGRHLYVDGAPFQIRGLCYSPVPIGENIANAPYGDYFTEDYAYMWYRDFPVIRAAGVNTLRIYGWNQAANHTEFLNVAHRFGFKLMLTFFLGTAKISPIKSAENRTAIIDSFIHQVQLYATHPAIIFWSFGNELNALWNNFVLDINTEFKCNWDYRCYNTASSTDRDCIEASMCMYGNLFDWINEAARRAKNVTDIPVTCGFADVDFMVSVPEPNFDVDKIALLDDRLPDLAAWSLQLYRGETFGKYFRNYQTMTKKPLLITEYGVDAYNDPCGWPENQNNEGACMNLRNDGQGGTGDYDMDTQVWCRYNASDCARPGMESQALWDVKLTKEIMLNSPERGGVVIGGFLMAWQDEFWKGKAVQDTCTYPCPVPEIPNCTVAPRNKTFGKHGSAGCKAKAHFTCSNWDTTYHDLCGYYLYSFPDAYVNEEWFGMAVPVSCGVQDAYSGHKLDRFKLRTVFYALRDVWSPASCFAFSACRDEDGLCCPDEDGKNHSCCSASTTQPSLIPTRAFKPTPAPTRRPTKKPTPEPPTVPGTTRGPTIAPTQHPSEAPTDTSSPTATITEMPTTAPTTSLPTQTLPPTQSPTRFPTTSSPILSPPTTAPSSFSSLSPSTSTSTLSPSISPSSSSSASFSPTLSPTSPTPAITKEPSYSPTVMARRRLLSTANSTLFIPSCRALQPCWTCLMDAFFTDARENCRPLCENMTNELSEPTRPAPTRHPSPTAATRTPTGNPTAGPTARDGVNNQQTKSGLDDPNTATALVLAGLLVLLGICYKLSTHVVAKYNTRRVRPISDSYSKQFSVN